MLLISKLAGGVGTTITGANRVILFDANFNPSHDQQSLFRVYRHGQKKPVYIYRLIAYVSDSEQQSSRPFIAQGCMESSVYKQQVNKQAAHLRIIDRQPVKRSFTRLDRDLYANTPITYDASVLYKVWRPCCFLI